MRDRDRATRARQQDEQAPRAHPGVSEDAPGDRIDLAEIVQQPAVGPERAELPCERGEVETVEERHQPCRGSGGAARHSHTSPPVARQETWGIAPSKPTRRRSSSVNPAPYSAQAAPSGVACTASASPTRAMGTWLSRRSSPANTARAARRAATYPRALGPARAASRVSTKRRRTARRAGRRVAPDHALVLAQLHRHRGREAEPLGKQLLGELRQPVLDRRVEVPDRLEDGEGNDAVDHGARNLAGHAPLRNPGARGEVM